MYAFRKSCEAVKNAVPLVEYAARFTKLEQRGGVLVGRCPISDHEDKTPSFTIWTNRFDGGHSGDNWHCFGCGRGSDLIDLCYYLDDHRQLWTAMVSLAEEYSVQLPRRSGRWHEATQRKADYLNAAARARGNILKRRIFRILILPSIDMIEDNDERKIELDHAWADWQHALPWPRYAEWAVASPEVAVATVVQALEDAKAEHIIALSTA